MTGFRNELLELLLAHIGQFVELKELVAKYCGDGNMFEDGDYTKVNCRLNINLDLRELKGMGWINLTPQDGLSTSHRMNHGIGKREFTLDYNIKARMTTKGEVEYRRYKQENESQTRGVKIGDGFSGVFIQDSFLRESPIASNVTQHPSTNAKASAISMLWKFMDNPIVKVVLAIITGLAVAYFAFIFKWRR